MIEDLRQKFLRHVRFFESELGDSGHFARLTKAIYLEDNDRRRNVERWAENVINSIIDLAKIALTIEKMTLGDSYRENVESLAAIKEFSDLDLGQIAAWTRLRNILAHEYLDVRWRWLEKFIVEAPPRAGQLLECAKKYLARISADKD